MAPTTKAAYGVGPIRIFFAEKIDAVDRNDLTFFKSIRDYFAAEREKCNLSFKEINERCFGTASNGGGMASNILTTDKIGWSFPTQEKYEALQTAGICNRPYYDIRQEYDDLKREYESLRRPFQVTPDVPYTDVWDFPTVQYCEGKHPCQKPVEMLRHIITASSKPGDLVLDCFGGSCVVADACIQLDRHYLIIEMQSEYVDIAKRRIASIQPEAAKANHAVKATRLDRWL
jgi:adenine-specific DNA-methyltransferase